MIFGYAVIRQYADRFVYADMTEFFSDLVRALRDAGISGLRENDVHFTVIFQVLFENAAHQKHIVILVRNENHYLFAGEHIIFSGIQDLPFLTLVSSVPHQAVQFIEAESPQKSKRYEEQDHQQKDAQISLLTVYADKALKHEKENKYKDKTKSRKIVIQSSIGKDAPIKQAGKFQRGKNTKKYSFFQMVLTIHVASSVPAVLGRPILMLIFP